MAKVGSVKVGQVHSCPKSIRELVKVDLVKTTLSKVIGFVSLSRDVFDHIAPSCTIWVQGFRTRESQRLAAWSQLPGGQAVHGWRPVREVGWRCASPHLVTRRFWSWSRFVDVSHMSSHTVGISLVSCAPSTAPPIASLLVPAQLPVWPPTRCLWPPPRSLCSGRGVGQKGVCLGECSSVHLQRGRRQGHHKRDCEGSRFGGAQCTRCQEAGSGGWWFAIARRGSTRGRHRTGLVCAFHANGWRTHWRSDACSSPTQEGSDLSWAGGASGSRTPRCSRHGRGRQVVTRNPVVCEPVGQCQGSSKEPTGCADTWNKRGDFGGAHCCHVQLLGLLQCLCWSGRRLEGRMAPVRRNMRWNVLVCTRVWLSAQCRCWVLCTRGVCAHRLRDILIHPSSQKKQLLHLLTIKKII